MKKTSLIITSCDRNDLLEKTLVSFVKTNTYPIEELIIRDDSGLVGVDREMRSLLEKLQLPFPHRVLEPGQIGQIKSIDKLMGEVKTEYVFHSEEDWEFYKPGFIEKSLSLMENPHILTAWIRPPEDNVIAFYSDEIPLPIPHRLVLTEQHTKGWSFNPHLMRMGDYVGFEVLGRTNCSEDAIGRYYQDKGFNTAWLIEGYCRHIGWDKPSLRPGTSYREGMIKA